MSLYPKDRSHLIKNNRQSIVKRTERATHSIDSFDERIKALQEKATSGDYQSQFRLEAIGQLLDPCLEFSELDVKKILNKGYSQQVERGLELYRLMRRVALLCEPVGNTVGAACRVKLINFEDLTFSKLFDVKGQAINLVSRVSDKGLNRENFNGLELLSPEEKILYQRLKPYFGGRKRPTLKSLAMGLLGEEDDDIFSDRSVTNYLVAVREFRIKHKDVLGFRWAFVVIIDTYNRDAKSVRERFNEIRPSMHKLFSEMIVPSVAMNLSLMDLRGSEMASKAVAASIQLMIQSVPKMLEINKSVAQMVASAAVPAIYYKQLENIEFPKINFRLDSM